MVLCSVPSVVQLIGIFLAGCDFAVCPHSNSRLLGTLPPNSYTSVRTLRPVVGAELESGQAMHLSPEAEEIFQQVRSLRESRNQRLQ
jgi:hypothetical protein